MSKHLHVKVRKYKGKTKSLYSTYYSVKKEQEKTWDKQSKLDDYISKLDDYISNCMKSGGIVRSSLCNENTILTP